MKPIKKSRRVGVRLTEQEYIELVKISCAMGVTVTELIRSFIKSILKGK